MPMKMDMYAFERVGLQFKAEGIPQLDLLSPSDPFMVLYEVNVSGEKEMINMSEVRPNTTKPDWVKIFYLDYRFEEEQKLLIEVYDQDNKDLSNLKKQKFVGQYTFTLGNIMTQGGSLLEGRLSKGSSNGRGKIWARGESVHDTRNLFVCKFEGDKLKNKGGFFGKSDPFIQVSRCNEDGSWSSTWNCEHIKNTLSPKFTVTKIPIVSLCNNDLNRPIRVEFFDWNSNNDHKSMGYVETSVQALLDSGGAPMAVMYKDKEHGSLTCIDPIIEKHPTFLQFLRGGLNISLSVAIDFTGSNGDPTLPSSLHYVDPSGQQLNEYQQAIRSVGNIIEEYNTDKIFGVFGFGAKIGGEVSHCFSVYPDETGVKSIAGLEKAYIDGLSNIALSGPTLLAPMVTHIKNRALKKGCTSESPKYEILLVLADGVINDTIPAIQQLIAASDSPMSIIIVGVGPADFSQMNFLDGDKGLLTHGGQTAKRDIVQFVPFTKFKGAGQYALAKEVLAEVPEQVLQYMDQHKVYPPDPIPPTHAVDFLPLDLSKANISE